jgi:putative thioredoxin
VLLGTGDVEGAFDRLIEVVRRTSGDDRDKARTHLVELFTLVGDADPRVGAARRKLSAALF